jgi:superfamily I DNA and RNA helicase
VAATIRSYTLDESAEAYKQLSKEQAELSRMDWDGGPRLVRGVAGSGKTIVLANNLARRLERMQAAVEQDLFGKTKPPRLLAVCYNRTLAPFLRQKIDAAYRQRTGLPLPATSVDVCIMNQVMYRLAAADVLKYQVVNSAADIVRILKYLDDLDSIKRTDPEKLRSVAYDAIYVDEGQDFQDEHYQFLKGLCRVEERGEPNLYVFYDDAQNLYAKRRPNWQSLGINIRGRSHVMTECFRNTRPIVEAAFNVLYGSCATGGQIPSKEFGDLRTLEDKGLIHNDAGFWRVRFAKREGEKPKLTNCRSIVDETTAIVHRLGWLIKTQEVRPEDVLVIAHARNRLKQLSTAITAAKIPGIRGVHLATEESNKNRPLRQPWRVTLSTVHSAKGYDAYCVLIASANGFDTDVEGRATFYVGCTRAIEYLEVFAHQDKGLAAEMGRVLARI